MAKRLQHRGGTTSQHSTFTGAVREVTVDTDKNTLVVHDGATAGGHPLATATNFTSTGIDDNATSTAITIDSSEKVGIGTASPSHELDVVASNSPAIQVRASVSTTGASMIVDGGLSNDSFLYLAGSGTGYYSLFRDGSQGQDLRLLSYSDTAGATDILRYEINGSLKFGTNASERMRIDLSGNVLVGTTSTSLNAAGFRAFSGGNGIFTKDDAQALVLNRQTSDGDILKLYKDGSLTGSVGSVGGNGALYISGSNNVGLQFNNVNDEIRPCNSDGTARDNAIDLGEANRRFKDLYLGGGLYVGGSGTANKLDDYEEGTWTPSLDDGTYTYSSQEGNYTKIGNMVFIEFELDLASATPGSATFLKISGLPFIPSSNFTRGVTTAENLNYDSSATYLMLGPRSTTTNQLVIFENFANTGDATVSNTDVSASSFFRGSLLYITNA